MKKLLVFFILALPVVVTAQDEEEIDLNILKAPVSPALNILGIAPSEIERPTDLATFTASLQQATNNFTSIPNTYAFQLAPFLLNEKNFLLSDYDKNQYTFKQTFLLSAGFTYLGPEGYKDVDSLKTARFGFGVKFSLIRPKWTTATLNQHKAIKKAQSNMLAASREIEDNLASAKKRRELRSKLKKMLADGVPSNDPSRLQVVKELNDLEEASSEEVNSALAEQESYKKTKQLAREFKQEREGPFLDFSSGFAFEFPDNRFNNSRVYRGGAWLTGGYESGNSGITSMFIVRYLYNPDSVLADPLNTVKHGNVSTLDAGGRFLISDAKGKFSVSAEAIYRGVLGKAENLNSSWRIVANADYDIGFNQKITFTFGRDFDGLILKGGNLVTALNFIAGFGTKRKID